METGDKVAHIQSLFSSLSRIDPVIAPISEQQRHLLLRGALYSVRAQHSPELAYKTIASWIALEDRFGDSDFSFLIALTVPNACKYSASEEENLLLFKDIYAAQTLQMIRTKMFVWATRSIQLGKDVV